MSVINKALFFAKNSCYLLTRIVCNGDVEQMRQLSHIITTEEYLFIYSEIFIHVRIM